MSCPCHPSRVSSAAAPSARVSLGDSWPCLSVGVTKATPSFGFPAAGDFVPGAAWAMFACCDMLFGGGPRLSGVVGPSRGSVAPYFLVGCGPCAFRSSAPYSSVALRAHLVPACVETPGVGDLVRPGVPKRAPLMLINSVATSTCAEAVDVMDGDNFAEAPEANVNVSYFRRTM